MSPLRHYYLHKWLSHHGYWSQSHHVVNSISLGNFTHQCSVFVTACVWNVQQSPILPPQFSHPYISTQATKPLLSLCFMVDPISTIDSLVSTDAVTAFGLWHQGWGYMSPADTKVLLLLCSLQHWVTSSSLSPFFFMKQKYKHINLKDVDEDSNVVWLPLCC